MAFYSDLPIRFNKFLSSLLNVLVTQISSFYNVENPLAWNIIWVLIWTRLLLVWNERLWKKSSLRLFREIGKDRAWCKRNLPMHSKYFWLNWQLTCLLDSLLFQSHEPRCFFLYAFYLQHLELRWLIIEKGLLVASFL
jgi:hypothetical protein